MKLKLLRVLADIPIESVKNHLSPTTNAVRLLWLPILALVLSVSASVKSAAPNSTLPDLTHILTERRVTSSIADMSTKCEHGIRVTVSHVLEIKTGVFEADPRFLEVRLCGDQSDRSKPAIHTDVTLVYDLASVSSLTGCLTLRTIQRSHDNSPFMADDYRQPRFTSTEQET